HQNSQSIELTRPSEGCVAPFPRADLLLAIQVSLQSRVVHVASDQLLASVQVSRNVLDNQITHEIVFICEITYGPHESRRGGFGTRFPARFGSPFDSLLILDDDLRIGAAQILFDERKWAARLMLFASSAIKQIPLGNVRRRSS